MSGLTLRPLTGPEELELFCRLPYSLNEELADDLVEGRRKPSWMWVALHGDRVLARVAWWSRPGDAVPALLDIFDLDDTATGGTDGSGAGAVGPDPFDAGVRLLRAALPVVLPDGARPEYLRSVSPGWRADQVERQAVENRMAALERTGARLFVERLRWEWTPQDAGAPQVMERDAVTPREGERDAPEPQGPAHGTVPPGGPGRGAPVVSGVARHGSPTVPDAVRWGRPASPGAVSAAALSFRSPRDREELLALLASVLEGTLDAHSRAALGRMSAREAAVRQYEEELVRYRSSREWWRVGVLPGGEPVGFVIPAHNGYHAIIAYLGVLPAYRGNGYADALLAEGTRVLAGQGVPRVRAATDLGNVPMSDAFRRAGYRAIGGRIDMTWE